MKIGIITFHWATNYGAVLQSFALQKTLLEMGHDVEIINYKPKQYENSLWGFIRYRHFLHPKTYLNSIKKEKLMVEFRRRYLNCSKRYYSIKELKSDCDQYDVLISGSDQVMNPSFLTSGEKGGSTAYFLDFGRGNAIRLTYAVSFGTTKYPERLLPIATPLIKRFNVLSVRETSGIDILAVLGRDDAIVVPDPTMLLNYRQYDSALGLKPAIKDGTLVYMLHNRLANIQSRLPQGKINTITSESIEKWIQAIKNSEYVITNSFHGMVFSILYHVPFTIVLKSTKNEGMNDRFYTLLNNLDLSDRIMFENSFCVDDSAIDWIKVEKKLDVFRARGLTLLNNLM